MKAAGTLGRRQMPAELACCDCQPGSGSCERCFAAKLVTHRTSPALPPPPHCTAGAAHARPLRGKCEPWLKAAAATAAAAAAARLRQALITHSSLWMLSIDTEAGALGSLGALQHAPHSLLSQIDHFWIQRRAAHFARHPGLPTGSADRPGRGCACKLISVTFASRLSFLSLCDRHSLAASLQCLAATGRQWQQQARAPPFAFELCHEVRRPPGCCKCTAPQLARPGGRLATASSPRQAAPPPPVVAIPGCNSLPPPPLLSAPPCRSGRHGTLKQRCLDRRELLRP